MAPSPAVKARPSCFAESPIEGLGSATRMLALAHYIERQIDDGAIPDYAAAARVLGVTRARLTQVMGLLLLASNIQERIVKGKLILTERALRRVVRQADWKEQLVIVGEIIDVSGTPLLSPESDRCGAAM